MLNKGQTEALVKHLRDIAVILESSVVTAASSSAPAFAPSAATAATAATAVTKATRVANKVATAAVPVVEAKKRGRKPGAVADEERCENVNDKQQRCKNRATKGTVCGKHLPA